MAGDNRAVATPSPRPYRLAAALAAGAVAVTAGVAVVTPDPEPAPHRPEPTPSPTPWSTTVDQVSFADERNGWALTPRCTSPTACDPAFWRTGDGGRTWRSVPAPAAALGRDSGVRLVAAGPATIAVEAGERRWLSVDGGTHWRRGPAVGVLRAAATPPAGVRLRVGAGTPAGGASRPRGEQPARELGWYSPGNGQPTAFATQPGWQPISLSSARDGSVWASGGNNQLAVWTGSWRPVRPVLPPPPRTLVQVAAATRDRAYLLVFGSDDQSLLRPTGVSRTTDGGRTWQLRSLRGSTLRGSRDAAVVGDRLVIVDSKGGVRIVAPSPGPNEPRPGPGEPRPGLGEPRRVDGAPALWSLDTAGRHLIGSGPQDGRHYVTTNGEVWSELQLPA